MSVSVALDLNRAVAVPAAPDEAFALVADVPTAATLFPGLERLVPLGDGAYRWEMTPVVVAQTRLQTVYASRYVVDPAARTVDWTPVRGVGNGQIGGRWTLKARPGGGTALALRIEGTVDVAMPALTRVFVVPAVRGEFGRLVGLYVERLAARLGGAV